MDFKRYMNIAVAMFEDDFEHRCQHFSFVIYKGRIISIARNSAKTSPIHFKNRKIVNGIDVSSDKQVCSEWNALRKIKKVTDIPLNRVVLVNIRLDNNKQPTISAPCMSCQSLINFFNIKKVFFTDRAGNFQQWH